MRSSPSPSLCSSWRSARRRTAGIYSKASPCSGDAARDRRLLAGSIDSAGAKAVGRRFQLALVWLATGTLLGILVPPLGVAVIAAFIPYYWLPIRGEIARMRRRRGVDGQA
ncbi:hypothetical protein GCM10009609_03400 [Pseudonocardia aurantiaca]